MINNQAFTNLLGSGLTNQSGVLTIATSSLGQITSVGLSAPTGFSVSGSPVTTSGTLALSYAAGYEGLRTASSTEWANFYNTPSSRISVANNLAWTGEYFRSVCWDIL